MSQIKATELSPFIWLGFLIFGRSKLYRTDGYLQITVHWINLHYSIFHILIFGSWCSCYMNVYLYILYKKSIAATSNRFSWIFSLQLIAASKGFICVYVLVSTELVSWNNKSGICKNQILISIIEPSKHLRVF